VRCPGHAIQFSGYGRAGYTKEDAPSFYTQYVTLPSFKWVCVNNCDGASCNFGIWPPSVGQEYSLSEVGPISIAIGYPFYHFDAVVLALQETVGIAMVEVVEDLIVPHAEHGQQAFERRRTIFSYGIFPLG